MIESTSRPAVTGSTRPNDPGLAWPSSVALCVRGAHSVRPKPAMIPSPLRRVPSPGRSNPA